MSLRIKFKLKAISCFQVVLSPQADISNSLRRGKNHGEYTIIRRKVQCSHIKIYNVGAWWMEVIYFWERKNKIGRTPYNWPNSEKNDDVSMIQNFSGSMMLWWVAFNGNHEFHIDWIISRINLQIYAKFFWKLANSME